PWRPDRCAWRQNASTGGGQALEAPRCRGGAPRGERPASLGAERLDGCSGVLPALTAPARTRKVRRIRTRAFRRSASSYLTAHSGARRRSVGFAAKLRFAGCLTL